jgi:hypothetical protein
VYTTVDLMGVERSDGVWEWGGVGTGVCDRVDIGAVEGGGGGGGGIECKV